MIVPPLMPTVSNNAGGHALRAASNVFFFGGSGDQLSLLSSKKKKDQLSLSAVTVIAAVVGWWLRAWGQVRAELLDRAAAQGRGGGVHGHVGDRTGREAVSGDGQLRDEAASPAAVADVQVRPHRARRRGGRRLRGLPHGARTDPHVQREGGTAAPLCSGLCYSQDQVF